MITPGQPKATRNVLAWLRGDLDTDALSKPSEPEEAAPRTPPEPEEEVGPTFELVAGKLDLVTGTETSDFHRATQESLHRTIKRRLEPLREVTARVGNQHPQLSTVVEEYARLIAPPTAELDVVDLWAGGNALMAQASSFSSQDKAHTLTEPLEPSHLGLLTEVAALHGGFILGFPRAAELSRRADEGRFGANTVRTISTPTSNILSALARQRRFLSERAKQLIEAPDAVFVAGAWEAAHLGYTTHATVRNALVAIGRLALWINDKGGTLAGGVVVTSAIAALGFPPETLQAVLTFIHDSGGDILSFAAPFPELRMYLGWIIDHFDTLEARSKGKKERPQSIVHNVSSV